MRNNFPKSRLSRSLESHSKKIMHEFEEKEMKRGNMLNCDSHNIRENEDISPEAKCLKGIKTNLLQPLDYLRFRQ